MAFVLDFNITYNTQGDLLIENTSTGVTDETFAVAVVLKKTTGDVVQVVVLGASAWVVKEPEDGWYVVTLTSTGTTTGTTVKTCDTLRQIDMKGNMCCIIADSFDGCGFDLLKWERAHLLYLKSCLAWESCAKDKAQKAVEQFMETFDCECGC